MRIICLSILLLLFACSNNNITLPTADGKDFHFADVKKNKASVFVFLATECPLSQSYTSTLNTLQDSFTEIPFYAVFPGGSVMIDSINYFNKKYGLNFISIVDKENTLTNYLKATVTPEVFVLDNNLNLLYSGRIDDWAPALGTKKQVIQSHDLKNALILISQGKRVKVKRTESVGCIIE